MVEKGISRDVGELTLAFSLERRGRCAGAGV